MLVLVLVLMLVLVRAGEPGREENDFQLRILS
jgi:hypothetical protein